MKIGKKKDSWHVTYLDKNIFYWWDISQKLPMNILQWREISKFNEYFIKINEEDIDVGCILGVDIKLGNKELTFYLEKWLLINQKSLCVIHMINKNILYFYD